MFKYKYDGAFVGETAEIQVDINPDTWRPVTWDGEYWREGDGSPANLSWNMSVVNIRNRSSSAKTARPGRNSDGSLTSGVDVVDPGTGGAKGMKQERYGLIPTWPIAELARVYGYGAQKYDDNNWRKGYRWGLSYDALQRHINAFWAGESIDPESGLHHLAHAMFHLNTLMTYEREGLGTDDRADI